MKKKLLVGVTAVSLAAVALTGCSSRGDSSSGSSGGSSAGAAGSIPKGARIGVALPAKTSENWVLAGKYFTSTLTAAGFKPDVQYANQSSPVPDQQSQITNMITKGDKAIIIGAADGSQLGTQVAAAAKKKIPVIAWDRNILNTKNVDYYVAFNNFKVGQLQGQALLDGMKKRKAKGPYQIELIAGSPDDANAPVFFNGAMDVLMPKIKDGTLKVASGQTTFKQVSTQGWLPQNAQARMTNVVTKFHAKTPLDGILSPNDTLGRAAIQAVKQAGKPNPIVTGQDSEAASIPLIMNGTQYSTIYKNTQEACQAAADLVTTLSKGQKPNTVQDKQNNNGVKIVPTVQLTPVLVTKENAVATYKDNATLEALAKKG